MHLTVLQLQLALKPSKIILAILPSISSIIGNPLRKAPNTSLLKNGLNKKGALFNFCNWCIIEQAGCMHVA